MDHFMGIDTFIRSIHVSLREVDIFGPPGLSAKMASKLAGYDWNLCEPYWCSLLVHEIYADHLDTHLFSGADGFTRRFQQSRRRHDRVIYRNRHLSVEAAECDHRIASLIFRISESPPFLVDMTKLENAGLIAGPWLRQLKKGYHGGDLERERLLVTQRGKYDEVEEMLHNGGELYNNIRREVLPASIGYVTDIGFSEENLDKVCTLLSGVTLLLCECSFLAADRDKARISSHLCTSDVNILLDLLRPAIFMPMHLSKSYIHRWDRLYDELEIPPGVTLLRLPMYLTPRPLLNCEAVRVKGGKRR
jgi:ribonuclease Z